jgi:DNA-binding GntR family transcriptional regulator
MAPTAYLSKSDYVYDDLKGRILREELPPGSAVNQERIAEELGVSTTPLREALKRLGTEGLIILSSHRDARVPDLSVAEARSLFEVRLNLDPLAAGLAAERRDGLDIAAMRQATADLMPLSRLPEWGSLLAHREYHRAIYHASHNQVLIGILDGLWDKADRYRLRGLRNRQHPSEHQARVRDEHESIVAAVESGDAVQASRLMYAHVDRSVLREVITTLEGTPLHD